MPRKKFDRAFISQFTSALDSYDDLSSEINLKELVEECFEAIDRSVKKKVSWDKIIKILKDTIGSDMNISPNSLRNYYLEIQRSRRQEIDNKKLTSLKNKQSKGMKPAKKLQKTTTPVTEFTSVIADVNLMDKSVINHLGSNREEVSSDNIGLTPITKLTSIDLEDEEESERIRRRREKYGSKIVSNVQEAYPNFNFGPERK